MATKRAQSKVSDSQQTLNELKTHQKECTLRYKRIEERLNEGSEKFKKTRNDDLGSVSVYGCDYSCS